MQRYEHGGNIWAAAKKLNVPADSLLDLSTCVADEFPPDILPVLQNYDFIKILPEPYSESFSSQYFNKYGGQSLLTSGTTEAISAICRLYSGKKCATLSPTYSDYEYFAAINGMNIFFQDSFRPEDTKLTGIKSDIFFICNPNNPTGRLIPKEIIASAAAETPETLFIIDESYMQFVDRPDKYSLEDDAGENIAVLRSFSKTFCLPGLRIGYIAGSEKMIKNIKKIISPWNVNTNGQKIAEILLKLPQLPVSGLCLDERGEFLKKLSSLPYLTPLPGDTHFFLCRLNGISAPDLCEKLLKQGILIRDCSNVRGLGAEYVRISMRKGWEKIFIAS
ncbi:MAG: aminotransferase class I/II-fold pyridoxal phosphate-dependent enzyme [Deferribacteraceae bacterium]|jgi:threonine-phosphate decarboxylase|nr:aminotransferase class I/II-fold pyridoxal phosphate-dependent enzyme [Deferribacteraceae bacterium]